MSGSRRIPPHAVDRPALRRQLDAGIDSPLSLVVAPAGAGKTVLLSQWAHSRSDVAVAWFDITAADDSPGAFASRLVAGISAVVRGLHAPTAPLEASEGRLGDPFLEDLAASLGDVHERLVLVFDDLDRLSGTSVLTDLWRLVDMLPPNVHAVFSSRVDLQLGWSRHRLEHGLVEIRQRELAFDDCTTAQVIEHIAGKPVTEHAVAAVTARTEGWAVGVQLTALSLRFAEDPDRVVDELTGTDRLVVDYLSEEVLDALETTRSTALMRLSVVDEVSAGLVEALADVDGATFLANLERDSMFIVAVPERPGWFRFHRLFRDLLLYRLRAADPRAEAHLLEIAADWHLDQGDLEIAVDYLLRARRWERAIERVLLSGREVFEQSRTATVARWLGRVPAEVRATHIDAELLRAIAEGMSGRGLVAVDAMQALLAGGDLSIGQRQIALAYLAASVQFHPHAEPFARAAVEALALLDAHPDADVPDLLGLTSKPFLVFLARGSLGRAHLFLGDLVGARRHLAMAAALPGFAYTPYRVHLLGSLALVEAIDGRLGAATAHSDEALETARSAGLLAHPAPADAYLARAIVAVQRGEPDVGALALAEGIVRSAANQRTQLMWIGHAIRMLIDPDDDQLATAEPPGPPPALVRQWLATIALRQARLRGVVAGSVHAPPVAPTTAWSSVAFEEIAALLTDGQTAAANARIRRLAFEPDAEAPLPAVELAIVTGWTQAQDGRRAQARDQFEKALALAAPEWLAHPFLRAGPAVVDLVEELTGGRSEFARFVIARARAAGARPQRKLLEELTPRELELLAFLPSRLTIADIAARCFVSTNTVKTHLGHIYRKLGVSGRDAAIEHAVELGLLDAREIARVG